MVEPTLQYLHRFPPQRDLVVALQRNALLTMDDACCVVCLPVMNVEFIGTTFNLQTSHLIVNSYLCWLHNERGATNSQHIYAFRERVDSVEMDTHSAHGSIGSDKGSLQLDSGGCATTSVMCRHKEDFGGGYSLTLDARHLIEWDIVAAPFCLRCKSKGTDTSSPSYRGKSRGNGVTRHSTFDTGSSG